MEVTVFKPDRMRTFARMISMEMGVEVRLVGREIKVMYGPPPVIFLPNMEYATEEDVKPLLGFCLHEAGHIVYSDFKILEDIPNYLIKMVHNALEDEMMERAVERDFPGAREMFVNSYTEGLARLFKDAKLPVVENSFIGPDGRKNTLASLRRQIAKDLKIEVLPSNEAALDEALKKVGLNVGNDDLMAEVGKRLEIERAARMWIFHERRYPNKGAAEWVNHPWKPVFDEVCQEKARNSKQTYEQALEIIKRLEILPILPGDIRPIVAAKEAMAKAEELMDALREARKALNAARRALERRIRERADGSLEHQKLLEKRDDAREAKEEAEDASKRLAKSRERLKEAKDAEHKTRDRLANLRKQMREVKNDLREAEGELKEMLEKQLESLKERAEKAEETLRKRQERRQELQDRVDKELDESLEAKKHASEAKQEELAAEADYDKAKGEIRKEETENAAGEIGPLEAAEAEAKAAADEAAADANKILVVIQTKDGEVEAQIEPGALERLISEVFEHFRDQEAKDELEDALDADSLHPNDESGEISWSGEVADSSARKYCPYTREYDTIDRVMESPDARKQYEDSRAEYAKIIEETTAKLRRLYSPEKIRLKVNVEEGKIDPRKAYKIGLAKRGAPVDLSKIFRTITVKKDPKVAVSLLIDCSGSMTTMGSTGKTSIHLARQAAACLSEVMSALNIPHEIIGHTTWSSKTDTMLKSGKIPSSEVGFFSRVVPFRGYLFKAFDEHVAPTNVFSDFELEDNLDGEAVLWAVQRLAARREKTKICISISDGMPLATMSHEGELSRHLFMVCKQVEAREKEGLFLFGLGIGKPHVKRFFKHAPVIMDVAELPAAVLEIVENVLVKLVGSLA